MPKMVQELARYDGKTIKYDSHTNGGWTLQKHASSAVILTHHIIFISNYENRWRGRYFNTNYIKIFFVDNNPKD